MMINREVDIFVINFYVPIIVCGNINNQMFLVSLYQTSSLVKRWLEFLNHGLVIVT